MEEFRRKLIGMIDLITSIMLGILSLIYAAQVAFRYILNSPIIWADELSGYLFVWMTFLGCAVALGEKSHVNIDLLLNYCPQKIRNLLGWISDLSIFSLLIILVYFGYILIEGSMGLRTTTLNLPFGTVYSIIFISSVLMLIILALNLMIDKREKKK